MTLINRVQRIERSAGAFHKDPRDMTLLELYETVMEESKYSPPDRELKEALAEMADQLRQAGVLV